MKKNEVKMNCSTFQKQESVIKNSINKGGKNGWITSSKCA